MDDRLKADSEFQAGKAAFIFEGEFLDAVLENDNGFHNFGTVPLPTKDGKPQYHGFDGNPPAAIYVSQNTKHYNEVKLFLNYLIDHLYPLEVQKGIENSPIPAVNKREGQPV